MAVLVKMQINDEVSDALKRVGEKSPQMLSKVLFAASMSAKDKARSSFRAAFKERTAFRDPKRAKNKHMINEINFLQSPKRAKIAKSFKLKGPRLGSVYEYNGADIFPKGEHDVITWRDENGNWCSSNFVHIDPRPFFYPSMREFVASGQFNKSLAEAIDRQVQTVEQEVEL